MSTARQPLLSVIVTTVGGPSSLEKCLRSLARQAGDHNIEVIIPYNASVTGINNLRSRYPQMDFIDIGDIDVESPAGIHARAHAFYDRCKSVGLTLARGEYLALLDDTGVPDPDWCTQTITAHQLPHGVIGGAVDHAGTGSLNWAIYFHDFGRYQLPLAEGPAEYLTDVNICYKRAALESVKELWSKRYNEVTVNWALAKKGTTLWLRPQMIVRQDRGRLALSQLIPERFAWGRLFGSVRAKELSTIFRWLYAMASPFMPIVLTGRIAQNVFAKRRHRLQFLRSLPAIMLLISAWSLGEFTGYVTGHDS